MAAGKTHSPSPPRPELRGALRVRIRVRRPAGDGGRRRDVELRSRSGSRRRLRWGGGDGGGVKMKVRPGSPRRRGGWGGGGERDREVAGGGARGGDVELIRSGSPRRRWGGGGGGERDRDREDAGDGAGRGGDVDLWSRRGEADGGSRRRGGSWSGSPLPQPRRAWGDVGERRRGSGEHKPRSPPPPRHGRSDGGERRGGGGRRGDSELKPRSSAPLPPPPPPPRGGGDGRRYEAALSSPSRSASAGGGAVAKDVVHACQLCTRTFDRIKALHGHMRSCRTTAEELPPPPPPPPPPLEEKKADDDGGFLPTWTVTGRRGRGPASSHGGGAPSPAKRAHVEIPRKVLEDQLDQRWTGDAEVVRAAETLMLMSAGEAMYGALAADELSGQSIVAVDAGPQSKIPEVNNFHVITDDEDMDVDVEPNSATAAQIDASPVTIAVAGPDVAATVTYAPALPDAAAAVSVVAPPPATPPAIAAATPATAAPAELAIAAIPATTASPAKGSKKVSLNNGEKAKPAKVYRCKSCFKTFRSHHALGGHMVSHVVKRKKDTSLQDFAAAAAALPPAAAAAGAGEEERHDCNLCFKVFRSGQALGGHMRLHYPRLQQLVAGDVEAWVAPPGYGLPEKEEMSQATQDLAMGGYAVHPFHAQAATAFGWPLPATTTNFPFGFAVPEAAAAAMPLGNGAAALRGIRLFGVDITE